MPRTKTEPTTVQLVNLPGALTETKDVHGWRRMLLNPDPKNAQFSPVIDWDVYESTWVAQEWPAYLAGFGSIPGFFGPLIGMVMISHGQPAGALFELLGIAWLSSIGLAIRGVQIRRALRQLSESHLRAWLKHHWQMVPTKNAFSRETYLLNEMNDPERTCYLKFGVEDGGERYTFSRTGGEKYFRLLDSDYRSLTVEPKRPPKKIRPQVAVAEPDRLAPFDRQTRTQISAARETITALRLATDLDQESVFVLDRSERMLDEVTELGNHLDDLKMDQRDLALANLKVAINTAVTDLGELKKTHNAAVVKRTSVLARYARQVSTKKNENLDLS